MKNFLKAKIYIPSTKGLLSAGLIKKTLILKVTTAVIYLANVCLEGHNKYRVIKPKNLHYLIEEIIK